MSQSLKSYPKYKDSGIQWIGKIPEGWEVRRIKFIAQVYSGTDGKNDEGNFPLYGANGIIGKCERPTFKRDKVIIGRVGSSGEINYAQGYYCVSDNALVVDNKGNILPRYLFYFLSTIDFSVDVTLNAQPLLTATNVKNKLLFLPPLPDQTTIANFLDKKTAKIDALIEKDKKLIELLKEKRTALINHAVTKGLDPNVKLKDSGVKWIGKIPEGWEV
ncbi:MAG: restriction endonuclease subunit S, partial [Candidatus Hodarchaeales archaeon]